MSINLLIILIYVIVIIIVIFIWWSHSSHPGTYMKFSLISYNHMTLMSLRSRSHVNASMVLTRADHLFIYKCIDNYIRSLLNIISRPILMVRTRLEPVSYFLGVWPHSQLIHTGNKCKYYNISIILYIIY